MSNIDRYELERTFELHAEFHGRDEAGLIKDKIYKGIFEKTLLRIHGYKEHEIKAASKKGWLKRTYINPDGNGIRVGYLWMAEEMPQRNWFKTLIDKIYRWATGEYDRYYGKG